jgi:threonylcarbamoyladenosine tRNA methylthiotransferase MtaB
MKVYFDVIGCRLNQSEVEEFSNQFMALGHDIVPTPADADIAIVNTCTVTGKAAADSRKRLRKAGRDGARTVVATGCWASLEPETALKLPGVNRVILNEDKDILVSKLLNKTNQEIATLTYHRVPLPGDRSRTRAFIKVQEGCDNHCTYCITRIARGRSRSRNFSKIQKDIQAAIDGGASEIVLTGVQLGAWGRDFVEPLALKDLIKYILTLPIDARVRLSSIEPWDFDTSILSLWKDERLCRQLHLPLQSGSDKILRRMGRQITLSTYQFLIDKIRKEIPEIAITTDVITGFPGESEADFKATQSALRQIAFAGGHVFTYSPRPGTAAYQMEGQIALSVAKKRNESLRNIFAETGHLYRNGFIGRELPVLWEYRQQIENNGWQLSGLTDNYIRVFCKTDLNLRNKISNVYLTDHAPSGNALFGEVMNTPQRPEQSGL